MKKWIFLCLLALSVGSLYGQRALRDALNDSKVQVFISPQHLWVHQLRVEANVKLFDYHWLLLSPHYVQNDDRHQKGFGMDLSYRWHYLRRSSYFSATLAYTYSHFETWSFDPLLNQNQQLFDSQVNRYGLNITHGHNLRVFPHFYADIYYGVGYRFCNQTSSDGLPHSFITKRQDYGSSGLWLILGVRFGFAL